MYSRLFILLAASLGLHLFLCLSSASFFAVSGRRPRIILLAAFVALSFSFIASAIIIRLSMNPLTAWLYTASAFWAGLALYLAPAALICWLIRLLSLALGRPAPMRLPATVLFAASLAYSAYGVWNAFHPVIKEVEIGMARLPRDWRGKVIVQISDVHLGAVYSPEYFGKVARTINSLNPDVIFITGDLFDSVSADGLAPFIGPLNGLKAKDGIFYVSGNHENYVGIGAVRAALAKTGIRALFDEAVRVDGMQIIGIEYPEYGRERDAVKEVMTQRGFVKGTPSILLYHTPTSIEMRSRSLEEYRSKTYWTPDMDYSAARSLGAGLQLSGHTHGGQMFPFNLLSNRIYKGHDYGLHREGGFSIYVSCGLGSIGPPMRTGRRPEIVVIRLKDATSG